MKDTDYTETSPPRFVRQQIIHPSIIRSGRVIWVRVGESLELLLVHRLQEILVDRGESGYLASEGFVKVRDVQRVTLKNMIKPHFVFRRTDNGEEQTY